MESTQISNVEFTKNLLSIIFAQDRTLIYDGLVKELINGNPHKLDFETIINHKRGRELQMTLHFNEEIYMARKGKISSLKGYFKYLGQILCYCRASNSGGYDFNSNYFRGAIWGNIKNIEIHSPPTKIEAAKQLLKKIHKNLWSDLKKELQDYIDGKGIEPYIIRNNGAKLRYKSISSVFDYSKEHELSCIKKTIEATSYNPLNTDSPNEYSWRKNAMGKGGRDLSISIRNGYAWYSSEYQGCGNGDYWLLINPNTAVFCEVD